MYFKKTLFLITFCFSFSSPASAKNMVLVNYEKPSNTVEAAIQKDIKDSGVVEEVAKLIDAEFRLPTLLTLEFGGEDGPLYDPEVNKISIPYYFINVVQGRFNEAKYSETGVSVKEATMDALMHTLFHELGHVLISVFDLPVLGKEEDAADSLASVLLIEYFEGGAEIAISAADFFDLESGAIEELNEEDFWGLHSLDAQRYYNTLCHVYGSDSDEYAHLKKEIGLSDDRAGACVEEYDNLLRSWEKLLKQYLKQR